MSKKYLTLENPKGIYVTSRKTLKFIAKQFDIPKKMIYSLIIPQPKKHEFSKNVLVDFSSKLDNEFSPNLLPNANSIFAYDIKTKRHIIELIVTELKMGKMFNRCDNRFVENIIYIQNAELVVGVEGLYKAPSFKFQCGLDKNGKKVLTIIDEITLSEKVFTTKILSPRNMRPLYSIV